MSLPDAIEFHLGDRVIVATESSHAPNVGDLVNIRKTTYRIIGRTYTVDHSDEPRERQVVCIINLAALASCPNGKYHKSGRWA